MKRIQPYLPAIGIFCLALLVRVVYNLTVAHDYHPLFDSSTYQLLAFNLVDEHCFCLHPYIMTVSRAPLWPFIIAGLSLIFGRADLVDRLFLCCLGSGTCVFIYLFARDLFNQRIGMIAGLMACIYTALYIYDGWMYTESLFTFLLIAICYCIYRLQLGAGRQRRLWVICGVLLALLSLTRPNGIIVLGLVILWSLWMIWRKHFAKRIFKNVILTALITCILIAPWTIRNYMVSGSFILVATGDGTVLLGSYNDIVMTEPNYLGTWRNPVNVDPSLLKPFPLYTCQPACEVQREDVSKAAALDWISTHLTSIPRLWGLRLLSFWTPDLHEADMPMHRFYKQVPAQVVLAMARTLPFAVFALAALGLVTTFKRRRSELFFIYGVILITLAEVLAYYGIPRFRAPIEPMLVLLAAGGLWWLTQNAPGTLRWTLRQRKERQQSTQEEARASELDPFHA